MRHCRSPSTTHSRVLQLLPSPKEEDPAQSLGDNSTKLFDFPCKNAEAFDVSRDGEYFAVVEEIVDVDKAKLPPCGRYW